MMYSNSVRNYIFCHIYSEGLDYFVLFSASWTFYCNVILLQNLAFIDLMLMNYFRQIIFKCGNRKCESRKFCVKCKFNELLSIKVNTE